MFDQVAESAPLLNMKQAARLLNVSEISLRRWTSSGRLGCVRIGPKRERRFRHDDLRVFLDRSGAGLDATGYRPVPGAVSSSLPVRTALSVQAGQGAVLDRVPIDTGSHLALIYANDIGRTRWSAPFLSDGLEAGDPCLFLAPSDVQWDVLNALSERGRDVEADLGAGRLAILQTGSDAAAVYTQFERLLRQAGEQGQRLSRVVGDMAWCFDVGLSVNELAAFEMRYEMHLAHRFPVISLCQYDARRFPGEALLDALKRHRDNFRQPPELFLA